MIRVKSALQAIRFASLYRRLQPLVPFRLGGSVLILVLCAGISLAQQPMLDVAATKYDIRHVLSDNNVLSGLLDKNGGLWVVTPRGLSYFDGLRFINFSTQDPLFKITNNKIRAITHIGDYIYAASDSTIDVIDIHSKKSIQHSYIHKGSMIRAVLKTPDERALILDYDGNLVDIVSGRRLQVGFGSFGYHTLYQQGARYVYLMDQESENLALIDLSSLTVNQKWTFEREHSVASNGLAYSSKYGILNLLTSGLVAFNPESGTETALNLGIPRISYYSEELMGQTLIASGFRNLYLIDADTQIVTAIRSEIEPEFYNVIITDGKRTLFIFRNDGITVLRIAPAFVRKLPTPRLDLIRSLVLYKDIIEKPDGNLLIFSYNGIAEYDPATDEIGLLPVPQSNYVSGILRGNTIFAATDGDGLVELNIDKPNVFKRHATGSGEQLERVYSILELDDGRLLLGYSIPLGILGFNSYTSQFDFIKSDFTPAVSRIDAINDVIRDDNGHFWVATNQGLFEFDEEWKLKNLFGNLNRENEKELPTGKINQVFVHRDGSMWIATDLGLFTKGVADIEFTEIKQFTGSFVASIESDYAGRFWIATYTGLVVYDHGTGEYIKYYQEDGFMDNEYNMASHLKSSSGLLYFGGLNGIVEVDPTKFEFDEQTSKFNVSTIIHDSKNGRKIISNRQTETDAIQVVGYSDILSIHVSPMDYLNAAYSRYEYRLAGYDDVWLEFQNGNLSLRNLPIGTYTIEIRAVHPSGYRFEDPIAIPVVVTEPFIRSVYFPVSMILLFMVSVLGLAYMRYRQKIELRTIRSNLMNDIHDELGGIMTKAALTTELLASKNMDPDGDLKAIQELYREGVQSLRNLLWSISSEDQSTQQFQVRATEWMEFIFRASPIEFMFKNQIPDARFNLSVNQRRQLVPIIKELATNTLKHSNGTQFILVLELEGKKYKLTATDNGHHEDTALSDSGYGLKGIKRRVAALGGTCTMEKGIRGFKTEIVF